MTQAAERPVAAEAVLPPEVADRLLYYASRAPSPHNAQGWLVELDGLTFRVRRDSERQVLGELDPAGHETDLAVGAVVGCLCAAAEALGYRADVAGPEVTLSLAGSPDETRLAKLRDRTTNRSLYRPDPVPADVLDRLQTIAGEAGLGLAVTTDTGAVAAIAAEAGAAKLSHATTQRELHGLMRFTGAQAARTRDGLDLELFLVPAAKRLLSVLALKPAAASRLAAKLAEDAEAKPIRSAPAVCLLHADGLEPDTFLRAGECFVRLALELTERGIAHAWHSAPVEAGLADPPLVPVRDRLLAAFGCPGATPLALFRIGYATSQPERRSLRRPPAARPADPEYAERTRRNTPAIPAGDQEALRRLRVLVAGCGSIGGAVIEPLVRMGAEQLWLAEPGDYELNNLNRQTAIASDVGRNKADVLAERACAISPHVTALVDRRGVTATNVDWLVGTTDVVIDGVDVTEQSGIRAKRLLHEEAWRQRRPVIAGLDLGGTQVVYVFDYRDGRVRPFGGKLEGAGDDLTALDLLSRLVTPLDVPRELLTYTESTIRGEAGSPPQLAPTASLFGVLAAWAVLDIAAVRPLRSKVKVAIPTLLMPRRQLIANEAARVRQLVRLKLMLEQKKRRDGI